MQVGKVIPPDRPPERMVETAEETFPKACRQCAMEEIVEMVRLHTVCSARGPGRSANTGPCVGRWRSSGGLSIQTAATVPLPSLSPSPSPGVRELTMPAVGGFEVFEIVRSWLGRRLGTPSTPCRKNVILIVEFSNPQTAVVKFVSKERLFEWKVEQKTVFSKCGSRYLRITKRSFLSFFYQDWVLQHRMLGDVGKVIFEEIKDTPQERISQRGGSRQSMGSDRES